MSMFLFFLQNKILLYKKGAKIVKLIYLGVLLLFKN